MEDGAALEAELSTLRQALQTEINARPFLMIREASADYIQIIQGISAVTPSGVSPASFPSANAFIIPSSTPTSPVNLAVVSNGLGQGNLVPYTRQRQGNIDRASLGTCVAGVEHTSSTAFIPAETLEIATGQAIKRVYGNTAQVQDQTVYVRRNGNPWRPMIQRADTTTFALIYAREDGSSVRAPTDTTAPWDPAPGDYPGTIYPKPYFQANGQRHRLQGIAITVQARSGEAQRTHEVILPLSPFPGHDITLATECSPAKEPVGELILNIEAPPEAGEVVTVYGPDPSVNGRKFAPGSYRLTVTRGPYNIQAEGGNTSGGRATLGKTVTINGATYKIAPLADPNDPSRGYSGSFPTQVSTLTTSEITVRYQEVPGILRVTSTNFYVAMPFQLQVIPGTLAPATPPPAFFDPMGTRIVLGREILGGFVIASFAEAWVYQGVDSDYLMTKSTHDTAQDLRAAQLLLHRTDRINASGVGVGYPPYNGTYPMTGYPAGDFYGSLLVRPGRYSTDASYWGGLKMHIWWALFFPIIFFTPCSYISNIVMDTGTQTIGPQPFEVRPGEETTVHWMALCIP